uniref:Uncharacterized protein n=1 Tax=Anguilla anguilla TaxID=7936 RepID=A0A0E9TIE4_ANGAN
MYLHRVSDLQCCFCQRK